jgi:rubrerythrin
MTPEQWARVEYMRERQDEAYKAGPTGTWAQRWIPGVCKHERTRCVHGDEIIGRNTRVVCMVCGHALRDRPLPEECFFTGLPH